jgi:hypothetical protein
MTEPEPMNLWPYTGTPVEQQIAHLKHEYNMGSWDNIRDFEESIQRLVEVVREECRQK